MSIFALLGISFLLASILLFGYQGMEAFMDMGTSDEFIFQNIRLADLLDISVQESIDGIPSIYLQSIAETLLTIPLAILLLAAALLFFFIHAFTAEKRIRKR